MDGSGQQAYLSMGERGFRAYRVPPLYDRNPPQDTSDQKGCGKSPLLAGYQKIAYGRMYGKYQAVVVISNSPDSQTMDIPVWQLGVTDDMVLGRPILTAETGYNAGVMLYRIKNGMLKLNMPPYSAAVFVSQPDEFYPVVDSRFADDGAAAVEK